MPYEVEIRPLAVLEILEAYQWYESQKDGLGREFLDELERFYSSLRQNPKAYSFFVKPCRQGKVRRFPFLVIYEVFDAAIIVYSVFMARQNPSKKRRS